MDVQRAVVRGILRAEKLSISERNRSASCTMTGYIRATRLFQFLLQQLRRPPYAAQRILISCARLRSNNRLAWVWSSICSSRASLSGLSIGEIPAANSVWPVAAVWAAQRRCSLPCAWVPSVRSCSYSWRCCVSPAAWHCPVVRYA